MGVAVGVDFLHGFLYIPKILFSMDSIELEGGIVKLSLEKQVAGLRKVQQNTGTLINLSVFTQYTLGFA